MHGTAFRTKDGLSAIYDDGLGYGMVLDDESGGYWRLDRASLAILRDASPSSPEVAEVGDLASGGHGEDRVDALRHAGLLVSPGSLVRAEQADGGEPALVAKMTQVYAGDTQELPSAVRVLEYALVNIRFVAEIRLRGWLPVRRRRIDGRGAGPMDQPSERLLLRTAEELLACMRVAALFPWTGRSCIPRALTAYEVLRRRGLSPRLVVGAYVEPFEPHIWVECGDQIVDSGHIDFSVMRFEPLSTLAL